jgi:hypothetical protein
VKLSALHIVLLAKNSGTDLHCPIHLHDVVLNKYQGLYPYEERAQVYKESSKEFLVSSIPCWDRIVNRPLQLPLYFIVRGYLLVSSDTKNNLSVICSYGVK